MLEVSENNQLRLKVESEMREGRNLLSQMSERTKTQIKRANRRLNDIRQNIIEVGEGEKYGLKVSMFS